MTPVILVGGAIILVILVALLFAGGGDKKSPKHKAAIPEQVKKLASAGRYEEAARLEKKAGHYKAALEYYLRAQKPALAAQMAERLDKHREAAELYEKAKNFQQAQLCYRKAGVSDKAEEMAERLRKAAHGDQKGRLPSSVGQALVGPEQRARTMEKECRALLAKTEQGDEEARSLLPDVAKQTAGALLQAGLTREAADLCRDCGLTDQAVNLYVNLLGDPGAAALLLAASGDHRRAAEFFEAAGQKERALASWIDWGLQAADPLEALTDVDRLGAEESQSFLTRIAQARAVTDDTAELAYRIGRAMEERHLIRQAIRILERVVDVAPKTADAKARLQKLRMSNEQMGQETGAATEGEKSTPTDAPHGEAEDAESAALDLPPPRSTEDAMSGADTLLAPDQKAGQGHGESEGPDPVPQVKPKHATRVEVEAVLGERVQGRRADDGAAEPNAALLEKLVARAAGEAAAQVAQTVAQASIEQIVRAYATTKTRISPAVSARMAKKMAPGIEVIPIPVTRLYDEEVEFARYGPGVEDLLPLIEGKEPGLETIEVYYRLGLAYMKEGHWTEARRAFETVEEISPGYRGAGKRASEIAKWQRALAAEEQPKDGKASIASQVSRRYEILGELGRGGMAVVYRARDRKLDREVGLKFLAEDMSSEPMIVEMFEREAKAAAQLTHPNIVTIYDYGVLDGRAFISMEFVRGITVEQLLEQQGKLKVIEALTVAEGILSALEHAHSKNIIHRDIKPSNMMVDEHGIVKLMDFGLAKWVDNKARTTVIAGTPTYMAPEQFAGKGVDAASDMFALGASLYEMLTGQPPFNGVDRATEPPPIREKNPVVPEVFEQLVMKTLAFDKKRRLGRATEALAQVRTILNQVTQFAENDSGIQKSGASVRRLHATARPKETKHGRADTPPREAQESSGDQPRGTVLSKPRKVDDPDKRREDSGTVLSKPGRTRRGPPSEEKGTLVSKPGRGKGPGTTSR